MALTGFLFTAFMVIAAFVFLERRDYYNFNESG